MNFSRFRSALLLLLVGSVIVGAVALRLIPGDSVRASAQGPTPGHTNAPGETNCTACHTEFPVNSGTGSVQITGIPKNYRPGQQIPVTVTVTQSDGVIWGFQLTTIDRTGERIGAYTLPSGTPPQLQIDNGNIGGLQRRYVSHTSEGTASPVFGSKNWSFTWTAPATRVGKIDFFAAGNAANSDGGPNGDQIYTTAVSTLSGSGVANFDTDYATDVSVFRPSDGTWYVLRSSDDGFEAAQFGSAGDVIVPGDYDGDGEADLAVWRPSNGVWYIQGSGGGLTIVQFGAVGDVPVVGDYDGDLKSDLAVWRPSTGVWYIFRSSDQAYDVRQFGISTDKVAQGDFDGDAKTDIAVYRQSNGTWYVWRSSDQAVSFVQFGQDGDMPVQSDYDGDGRVDRAVYRPSNGVWYMLRSSEGFGAVQFGIATDVPVPGDYDGDGKTDNAVYREGIWFIYRSSDQGFDVRSFGIVGDDPIPAGYIAR